MDSLLILWENVYSHVIMDFMLTISLKLVFLNVQTYPKNIMGILKLKYVNFNVLSFYMEIQSQMFVVNQLIVKLDFLPMILQINV